MRQSDGQDGAGPRELSAAWLDENATAIAAYNSRVQREGVFGDLIRGF